MAKLKVSSYPALVLLGISVAMSSSADEAGCMRVTGALGEVGDVVKSIGCKSKSIDLLELAKKAPSANCVEVGKKTLRCQGQLVVDGLKGTTINGQGWKLVFANDNPAKGGLVFARASDVVLKEIEISWTDPKESDRSTGLESRIYSFGVVHSCPKGGILELQGGGNGPALVTSVSLWDPARGWPWFAEARGLARERHFPLDFSLTFAQGKSECVAQLAGRPGAVIVRHHMYSANAFSCYGCERIAIEKVAVRSAPGMGFGFWDGGKGFLIRGSVIGPSCSPNCSLALPSIMSDAAHFAGVEGGILIEDNDFGWQGDDSVNVTGIMVRAVADPQESGSGWIQLDDNRKRSWLFRVGGLVAVFDMGMRDLGQAKVMQLDKDKRRVRLSRLPTGVSEFAVTAVNRMPRNVVIRNNRFHDHRGRGILMGASNAMIESNFIERVTMAAILLHADTDVWMEGPGAQDLRISKNRIANVNAQRQPYYPSPISAAFKPRAGYRGVLGDPIRNIAIDGNTFTNVFHNPDKPIHIGCGVANATSLGHSLQAECAH